MKNLTWGFRDYFEQNHRKFLCNMQYTPTHLKDQQKEHISSPVKQWTTADPQESPGHSVPAVQNGLGSHPSVWANREKAAEARNVFM